MHLAFADRDFYYGGPYMPPGKPIIGLLSKEYAREMAKLVDPVIFISRCCPGKKATRNAYDHIGHEGRQTLLSFAVQGGAIAGPEPAAVFLNVTEFGMTVRKPFISIGSLGALGKNK